MSIVNVGNRTRPRAVERRTKVLDDNTADVATDRTSVATGELITWTFSGNYRSFSIELIDDPSGTASDVIALAWTINAADDTQAALRLSLSEADADNIGDYVPKGSKVSGDSDAEITRIDVTGILGSGGTAVAADIAVARVW